MSLCIYPNCPNPENPDNLLFCHACSSELLLEGRYRVTSFIGSGSFYQTYEIRDRNRPKILKVLIKNEMTDAELLRRQAQVLAALNYPGIPRIADEGYFTFFHKNSIEPMHCLVMECVEGMELKAYLKQRGDRPIDQKLALEWLTQLTTILQKLHNRNLFHWHLDPCNIKIQADGSLALMDFGMSREATSYTPAEQINGRAVKQSDFFALGRTFVYLLTSQDPKQFYSPNSDACHWRTAAPNVSPILADFIDELMSRFPEERPANAEVILQRLAEIERALYPLSAREVQPAMFAELKPAPPCDPLAKNLVITPEEWAQKVCQFKSIKGHSNIVYSLAISPDGQTFVSASRDYTIKVWNLQTGECYRTLMGHTGWIYTTTISPDGQLVASGSDDNTIKVWNLHSGQLIRTLKGHSDWVKSVAIAADNETIVSGSCDNTIKVWNLHSGQEIRTIAGHTGPVNCVAIAPDGETLVSGSGDRTLKVWNLRTGEEKRTFKRHSDSVVSVAIGLDGETIVSGSYDNTIRVWNLNQPEVQSTLRKHSHWINSVALCPDNRTLISGSADKSIKVWNLKTGRVLRTLKGHSNYVFSVALDAEGRHLISGSYDGTIKIWRVQE